MATSSAGNVLVCGSAAGVLTFREIWSLKELFSISMEAHGSIKSLWFSEGELLDTFSDSSLTPS